MSNSVSIYHDLPKYIQKELARLQRYDDEISKVMPKDYKDWWQNSKEDWPELAAFSIDKLRMEVDEAYKEIERLQAYF